MLHLLQLEWKKLRYYRLFLILIGIYILGMPAMHAAASNMSLENMPGGIKSIYTFPGVWKYLGYLGSWMTFFCFGFLGVSLVTMEYSNKTLRQNIITGMSRKSFFLGKVYVMLAISLFAALYYAILALVFGYLNTDYIMTSRVTEGLYFVPRFFLMCFGYMSLAFMIGLIIRRGGIALFSFFTYSLMGEQILKWLVHQKVFGFGNSMNYYPINAIEDLVPIPFPEIVTKMMEEAEQKGYNFFLTPEQATITSLIYIAVFLGLAYYIFSKRDL